MSTTLYTSLAEIKSFNPCVSGWKDILKGQGKKEADNILFPLVNCLESNSINDVCWLLGRREKEIDIAVKFAKKCADSVSHIKNGHASAAASYATYAASEAASASAAYAAASVDASYDASYASYAASTAVAAASASADYASVYASATYAAAASAAYDKQIKLNKQFLIECIKEWEESH